MPARSKDKRWETKFAEFVHAYGAELLAERLGVSRDAVYKWVAGADHMRPMRAQKIVKLAKLRKIRISLDEIYQSFDEVRQRASNLRVRRK